MGHKRHLGLVVFLIVGLMVFSSIMYAAPNIKINNNTATNIDLTVGLLKDAFDWCKATENGYSHVVLVSAVSNCSTGVATYSEGNMSYVAGQDALVGNMTQYFSDRRAPGTNNPFDPKKTQSFKFSLSSAGVGTLAYPSASFQITFKTEKNVLYGFSAPGLPSLWTVSLKKFKIAIIK